MSEEKIETIFTKIIKGELPCHKVYEDDRVLAFMDIHPIQTGMVVVVSKSQVDHVSDLPDDDYLALMAAVKRISLSMREVFPGTRAAAQIEGFEVPHAHVKLFPIRTGAEFHGYPDEGEPDHEALAALALKLKV